MVLTHGHIDNGVLLEALHMARLREVDRVFVSVAKHAPVALTEGVQLAVLADQG